MDFKTCAKCKEIKPYNEFGRDKSRKDGFDCYCKECKRSITRLWQRKNVEKNIKNFDESKVLQFKKCIKCKEIKSIDSFCFCKGKKDGRYCYCKECHNERSNAWAKANPEKYKNSIKNWEIANYEKRKIQKALWKQNNPDKNREYSRKQYSTLQGRLNDSMRVMMRRSLNGKKAGRKWEQLAGYTVTQLEKHLKGKFTENMTWELFLKGEIHIDHIIPKSVFNYEKPEDEDFKKCWALKNLQPLWAKDNLSKHAKLNKHFQPSLIFSES